MTDYVFTKGVDHSPSAWQHDEARDLPSASIRVTKDGDSRADRIEIYAESSAESQKLRDYVLTKLKSTKG